MSQGGPLSPRNCAVAALLRCVTRPRVDERIGDWVVGR